jgi:hypothetical protein
MKLMMSYTEAFSFDFFKLREGDMSSSTLMPVNKDNQIGY